MRFLLLTALLACAALVVLPPSAAADDGWTWPVQGDVITSYRNGTDPYAGGQHRGIDIATTYGTRVSAAAAGTVTFAGTAGSSGLAVNLRTDDGRFDTSYLHLASAEVRKGDRVAAGERIGAVGTSGRRSAEQPHLHFGVREAGSRHGYVDPLGLLPPARPPAAPEPPPAPVPVIALPFLAQATPVRAEAAPATAPAPTPADAPGRAPLPSPALAPLPALEAISRIGPNESALAEPGRPQPRAPDRAADGRPARSGLPTGGGLMDDGAPRDGRGASAGHRRPAASTTRVAAPPLPPERAAAGDQAAPEKRSPDRRDKGIDLGWLAACLGLVTAALALGRPAGPVAAARRGREAMAAIARPLSGKG